MEMHVAYVKPWLAHRVPTFLDRRRADALRVLSLLDGREFDAIRRLGHDLKGVGASYGFDPITNIGRCLEDAARREDVAGMRDAARALERYVAGVRVVYTTEPAPPQR
jgi:HPt (histidine-containing phosphotransfer) domain-containing protein